MDGSEQRSELCILRAQDVVSHGAASRARSRNACSMNPVAPQIVASPVSYHHPFQTRPPSRWSSRSSFEPGQRRGRNGQDACDLRATHPQRGEHAHDRDERASRGSPRRTCGSAGARRAGPGARVRDRSPRASSRRAVATSPSSPGLSQAARERNLARVPAEMGRPLGEEQRRHGLLDQHGENGGEPLAGVGLRMRIRSEALSQRRAVIRERHGSIVVRPPSERRPRGQGRGRLVACAA